MDIKILGSGCKKCGKLFNIVNDLIESEELNASIEKIEDFKTIIKYGVMSTPGLIIDNEIIFTGSLPSKKKIKKILIKKSKR